MKRLILLVGLFAMIIGLVGGSVGCQTVRRSVSGVMPYHERSFTVPALHKQPISLELSAGHRYKGEHK